MCENTKNTVELGNTKTNSKRSRGYCFTLNNYTEEQCQKIQSSILKSCRIGFFNKEVGESGTPHLQGYIEFNTKSRPKAVFNDDKIHWSKAKGNRDQNFKYCSKDCQEEIENISFCHGFKKKVPLRILKELRPWQASMVELIDLEFTEMDDRHINWLVDVEGCAGKTQFCKYMTQRRKQTMIVTGGGYKDIACVLKGCQDENKFDLNDETVVIFNIPRDSDDQGMISYKALESLKDGLITSSKYESATFVFNSPVVWVLSNNEPELSKLSKDRWKLWTISDGMLLPYTIKPINYRFD